MRILLVISFLFVAHLCQSQTIEIDTIVTSKYKIVKASPPEEQTAEDAPSIENQKEDKNFGDLLISLGEGFINRLKYRFNLDEAIEEKSKKYKKSDSG